MIRSYYIGNKSYFKQYYGQKINNKTIRWIVKKQRILKEIVWNHVKGIAAIKTTPIFKQGHTIRCKFIAIRIFTTSRNSSSLQHRVKLFARLSKIFAESEKFFHISNERLFILDNDRSFIIYIPLEKPLTLYDSNIYLNLIKPRLERYLIDFTIHYYPDIQVRRGELIDTNEIPGKCVPAPFGYNFQNGSWSIVAFGNPFKIIPVDLTDFCLNIRRIISSKKTVYKLGKKRVEFEYHDPRKNIIFEPIKYFYKHPDCRPCIKSILDGTLQTYGNNGILMKMGVCAELYRDNAPISTIIHGFESQIGFSFNAAYQFVKYIVCSINAVGRPLTLSCKTIKKIGFCLDDCYKLGNTHKYKDIMMEKYDSVDGWEGLHAMNNKVVQETGKRYYYYKTTRSGTTTSVIIQALRNKKKILMIAPLVNIFEITVSEAIDKGKELKYLGEYDKFFTYRVKSNLDACTKLREKYKNLPDIDIFPFLYKANCKDCSKKIKDRCEHQRFLKEMDTYDLIYLTVKKFNALIKGGEQAKIMMDKLLSWCDIIFVDECSHIFDVEWDSMLIHEDDNTFPTDLINDWKKALNVFLQLYTSWVNKPSIIALEDFIQDIATETSKIMVNDEPVYVSFKNKQYELLNIKQSVELYQQFLKFFVKTRSTIIKPLIECFLMMNRPTIYLQLILPNRDPMKVFMASVSDIMQMVDFLNKNTKNKLLLLTDATEPPIRLNKCFDDLEYLYVNDPMKTSIKQTIYVLSKRYSLKSLNAELSDAICDVMDKHATNEKYPVFVVSQSIRIMTYLLGLIRQRRESDISWNIGSMDYFRGKTTKGTPSKFRKMIVFGPAHPPRHCYDYTAAIYRKAGFLSTYTSAEEAGRYLEQYSAQSAFFQAISRVKCPLGKDDSTVIVFGVKINDVRNWLRMKINTPKIIELK